MARRRTTARTWRDAPHRSTDVDWRAVVVGLLVQVATLATLFALGTDPIVWQLTFPLSGAITGLLSGNFREEYVDAMIVTVGGLLLALVVFGLVQLWVVTSGLAPPGQTFASVVFLGGVVVFVGVFVAAIGGAAGGYVGGRLRRRFHGG